MKKAKQLISALLAAAIMMTLCSCTTNASEIEDTLSEFEYACHNLDIHAMLNCIDPDVAEPIKFSISAYSALTGQDSEDVLDELVEAVFETDFEPDEFLSHITITDPKIKVQKNKATVTCIINFEIGGDTYHKDTIINMIKTDDKWYISGFEFPDKLNE